MAEKLGKTTLRSGWKLLLICLLGLIAVQPLFNPAMTCSDDGGLLLCRLVELDHCLRQGALWPRWTPDALYRGNLGESMALPLLPLILWAFRRLLIRGQICYLVLSALSYATLVLTHNVIGLIFTPFLILYVGALWLLERRTPRSLSLTGAALLLSLGLSACFWLPAFFEKQWVKIHLAYTPAGMNYRYNFLSLGELLSPPSPVHSSLMNPAPPRSLGLVQLVLALLAMAGWWSFKDREKRFNVFFFSLVLISLIFMVLPQSVAVWDYLPLLEYVQFPFRFLGIASLAAALLAGAAIFDFRSFGYTQDKFSIADFLNRKSSIGNRKLGGRKPLPIQGNTSPLASPSMPEGH